MGSPKGIDDHRISNDESFQNQDASVDDTSIIYLVCDLLSSNLTINKELLVDWKSELTDSIGDSAELSSVIDELILASPGNGGIFNDDSALNKHSILDFLSKFNNLDDELYHDLKIILFELFLRAISTCYTTKIQLFRTNVHEILISNLISIASKPLNSFGWLDYNKPLAINQHMRLIINFLELGCDIKCYKKLIQNIFDPQTNSNLKLVILELLNQIHSSYSSHFDFFLFNDFQSSSISIPFSSDITSLECLTLQSWFKLNTSNSDYLQDNTQTTDEYGDIPSTTLFLLANSSSSSSSILKVQLINNSQFMIEIIDQSNGSRMQYTFNQIILDQAYSASNNQGYVHFALTYDTYRNLNLYIDGEYSESIPCPELYKVLNTWNKVYVGQNKENPTFISHDELLIRNLTVLNTALTYEWVYFIFNLGLEYDWDFKDFNTHNLSNQLNHLSPKKLTNLAFKIHELKNGGSFKNKNGNKNSSINSRLNDYNTSASSENFVFMNNFQSDQTKRHLRKLQAISSNSSILSESSARLAANNNATSSDSSQRANSNIVDRRIITDYLSRSLIKQSNIVFDIHDCLFTSTLETPQSPKALYHRAKPIHGALYSIGGPSLLLKLIESATQNELNVKGLNDSILYIALNLLFTILQNNWRIAKEFENLNGYGLLLVLFTYYKENVNKSLTLNLIEELLPDKCSSSSSLNTNSDSGQSLIECNNLLRLILDHVGYDFIDPHESIIVNPIAYRFLVLNLKLYLGSDSFKFLLYHFQVLSVASRFNMFNTLELNRMKVLKKLIQFLKLPALNDNKLTDDLIDQLSLTLNCFIRSDTSVESIRSISLFIIYSLYHSSYDLSAQFGIITLKSLTDVLCDPNSSIKVLKKFSRSITIHWILLLFNYKSEPNSDHFKFNSKDVVNCGLTLLTKLLKILGTHIIKRFFQANHGLDILTRFLKDWWHDDQILAVIFLTSFGIDSLNFDSSELTLISVITNESYSSSLNQVIMPDFLLLLNNLVLNSMYTLGLNHGKVLSAPSSPLKIRLQQETDENLELSLNALHLISQYAEAIQLGFDKFKSLQTCYSRKDWLEGIFELIGHLRLSLTWASSDLLHSFQNCYDRLINVISNIFVSKLLNIKDLFKTISGLSEFTKTLVLDIIFPRIFKHLNEFVTVSNFIFNEKEFLEGTIDLMNYYYSEFVNKSYYVSSDNIDTFLVCNLSIIETIDNNSGFSKSHSANVTQLRKSLGHVIILKFLKLSQEYTLDNVSDWVEFNPADEERANGEFGKKINEAAKQLLYRQITILQNENVLDIKRLACLIDLLIGNFLRLAPGIQMASSEHVLNFLRTCYLMRQEHFPKILDIESTNSEYSNSQEIILEFFQNLLSKNDEESIKSVYKTSAFKNIFHKNLNAYVGQYKETPTLHVLDMIRVMLNNGGKLGQMDSIYIKSFEKNCEQLKVLIISGELVKFNRAIQDQQENIQFFVCNYNYLKSDINRLISPEDRVKVQYVLDYIENVDRMRRRLIVEDQLSDSEKLSYNIEIPIKKIEHITTDFDTFDDILANSGIDTLNLSSDDDTTENDDGYEVLDMNDASDSTSTTYEDKNRKVIRSLYMGDQIIALWNVSQINGLVPIESLIILGSGYLYLIENYFHCADGNVIDAKDAPAESRDPYLQLINSQSSNYLKNDDKVHRNKSWGIEKLSCISKRQFLLRDIAVEMFFNDGASILITCLSNRERDSIYAKLAPYATGKGLDHDLAQSLQLSSPAAANTPPSSSSASFLTSKIASAFAATPSSAYLEATKKWKMGEMSNFYYLMIINTFAGRTFNDLTQYPVFPWVIADYTSEELDFSDPRTFRDLSKPMGGQTRDRAYQFQERYEALDSLQDHEAPPFHYGTHYSSAMIVTSFLIRLKPYVQSYLLLQGGKFDHADRLFNSIERAWSSASKDNTTDVRELTPEFFYLPEFLVNSNNFEFGTLQNGQASNDVVLPPWAKGDPKIFIAKNREALESPYVSANLNLWIDLIFGFKQNGPEAVKALNVFHHLSYNGAINLDNINDDVEKRAIIGMINNFGQTPMKVFHKPHPSREILNVPNYYLSLINLNRRPTLTFESKLKLPIEKIEKSSKTRKWVGRPACITSEDDLLIRKSNDRGSLIINTTSFLNVHLSDITCILQTGHKLFLTGSADGIIQVWKCNTKPVLSLQFQCVMRGHIAPIKTLKFSKTFKVCISVDTDGVVIIWDLTRFKFIRKIKPPVHTEHARVLVSISNDTGNIVTIHSTRYSNVLTIYTINGEVILDKKLKPGFVTCVTFGSINDSQVNSGARLTTNNHAYWSHDIVALAFGSPHRSIDISEIVPVTDSSEPAKGQSWLLQSSNTIHLDKSDYGIMGSITALELFKETEIDTEDKICRGHLKLILGDSTGRVYIW